MFNLNEQHTTWPANVRGYSTNTPVLGGDNSSLGDSNLSLKDLTDRTAYLYDRLGRFEAINFIFSTGATVDASALNKLNYIDTGNNANVTVDDIANFKVGTILYFKCKLPAKKTVAIQTTGGQLIMDGNNSFTTVWLCDGEEFKLVSAGGFWVMMDAKGNFDKVGQDDLCRFQPRNSIIADGCKPELGNPLLVRTDMQRLWDKVSAIAIDDATWLSNIQYRCFFSRGNESTTFRPPDMRALFYRALDLGRGVRLGQLDNTPGSYEADDIYVPTGVKGVKVTGVNTVGPAASPLDSINATGQEFDLQHVFDIGGGSSETKPKNGGLLPIIYY